MASRIALFLVSALVVVIASNASAQQSPPAKSPDEDIKVLYKLYFEGKKVSVEDMTTIYKLIEVTRNELKAKSDKLSNLEARFSSIESVQKSLPNLTSSNKELMAKIEDLEKTVEALRDKSEQLSTDFAKAIERLEQVRSQTANDSRKLQELEKRFFFEDFSKVKPSLLPVGWEGKSLSVQKRGSQHVLQMRELGAGTVTLPPLSIQKDFYVECSFVTHGYVNKQRGMELVLQSKNGAPAIRVGIVDTYPNCKVTINGRGYHAPSVGTKSNLLHLQREGKSLQVKLNGEDIHALMVDDGDISIARLTLANDRDEYGRVDSASFPTIESIQIAPLPNNGK